MSQELKTRVVREISPEVDRLIKLFEKVKFGELRVKIQNGLPVLAENVVQQVKLDKEDDFNRDLQTVGL